MNIFRRLLYIPIIGLLVGCFLSIFNIMHFGVQLPIGVETVALIAGGVLAVLAVFDMRFAFSSYEHPEPEEPPRSTKIIYPKVMEDAVEAMDEAEEFVVKSNGRIEIEIDIEPDEEEV